VLKDTACDVNFRVRILINVKQNYYESISLFFYSFYHLLSAFMQTLTTSSSSYILRRGSAREGERECVSVCIRLPLYNARRH
jgi:hypothetical protein